MIIAGGDLSGRTYVVTGGNSGIGAATAAALAHRGGSVVLACRSVERGERAAAAMTGDVTVRRLDLADLASVRQFAAGTGPVDVLVNNAGVMAVPYGRTADGFEIHFGVNHLGHFALTGLLLPRLRDRVVTVTSALAAAGRLDLDDPDYERRRYHRWLAYADSKLANLSFAYELQRRLVAAGSGVLSLAAHPGYAATELTANAGPVGRRLLAVADRVVATSAEAGARPVLHAATSPDAVGGTFVGPGGRFGGPPTLARSSRRSADVARAGRLWELSEQLTGVHFLDPGEP